MDVCFIVVVVVVKDAAKLYLKREWGGHGVSGMSGWPLTGCHHGNTRNYDLRYLVIVFKGSFYAKA